MQRQFEPDDERQDLGDDEFEEYETEPDYGGVYDGVGTVYSDADPGL